MKNLLNIELFEDINLPLDEKILNDSIKDIDCELNEAYDFFYIYGVIAFFSALTMALIKLGKVIKKQIMINKLISDEKDPAKRNQLKLELKRQSDDEIALRREIQKINEKIKQTAEKNKGKKIDPKKAEEAKLKLSKLDKYVKDAENMRKIEQDKRVAKEKYWKELEKTDDKWFDEYKGGNKYA